MIDQNKSSGKATLAASDTESAVAIVTETMAAEDNVRDAASGSPIVTSAGQSAGQSAGKKPSVTEAERRKARLAAELRANLARRKSQSRARRQGEGDARQDGLPAALPDPAGRTTKSED